MSGEIGIAFALVLIALIAGVIAIYIKNPKIIWKIQAHRKLQELQPEIRNIKQLHYRTVGDGKNVGKFEKGQVIKSLNESKSKYQEYVGFLKSKELEIPDEISSLERLIEETEDALDPKGALDRAMERANREYNRVYALTNKSGEELFHNREDAAKAIGLVEDLVNSIARYPKNFDKDMRVIRIEKKKFKDAADYGLEQKKALENSAKGIGTGVAAGTAVVSMAPTAAMWVATTFGTASTGTAISALSGAAATNAALAWLGGGAIVAGGHGMVAGQALLAMAGPVGWGVAGASIFAGILFTVGKRFKILDNKKKQVEQIKNCTEALKELKAQMEALTIQTKTLTKELETQFSNCAVLNGMDFNALSEEQVESLGALVNNTKSLSMLIGKTLEK